ncbi:MAG: right-handed parallel beta-helix repeat-containing protein, partial [candidate division WOR-3 bacterium]
PVRVVIHPGSGTHHSGAVTNDETWQAADNPHVIDGVLMVDAVLTIGPGATVLMGQGAGIVVGARTRAALKVVGKPDSVISFLPFTAGPTPGFWRSIELLGNATCDSNIMRHCILEFGGAGGKGLVYLENTNLALEGCSLRFSSSAGVVANEGGFTIFRTNSIRNCADFPIRIDPEYAGTLQPGSVFSGNNRDRVLINPGTVKRSATWANLCCPYELAGTVTVAGETTPVLTLAAGCSLLFADSAKLRVGVGKPGALFVDGSFGAVCLSGASGRWPGIEFWEWTDQNRTILKSCLIRNAGFNSPAAIFCYHAPVTLNSIRIESSFAAGVYCSGCGFNRFLNTTITGCAGYPVHIEAPFVGTMGVNNRLTGNSNDMIEVVGGTIARDAEWHNQGVPYLITGDVDVGSASGPTLVIAPGTRLIFADRTMLRSGRTGPGTIVAVGTREDSITFTTSRQPPTPGAWRGIELLFTTTSSTAFEFCRLLYGGGEGPGILCINSCVPRVRNCEIGWSANYCIALFNTNIEAESLRSANWLHDWGPEPYEDIYEGGP